MTKSHLFLFLIYKYPAPIVSGYSASLPILDSCSLSWLSDATVYLSSGYVPAPYQPHCDQRVALHATLLLFCFETYDEGHVSVCDLQLSSINKRVHILRNEEPSCTAMLPTRRPRRRYRQTLTTYAAKIPDRKLVTVLFQASIDTLAWLVVVLVALEISQVNMPIGPLLMVFNTDIWCVESLNKPNTISVTKPPVASDSSSPLGRP